ncbi:MAG TPA: lysophospholipid acyltransferase family protein [Streptosporangiaceae bacterium]
MTAAAPARRALWRAVFALTGGLRVEGDVPAGPCVVVANHSSHADTAALLAALHARTRPGVAAAADYWFGSRLRTIACRALVGAFPVRRDGGGGADLLATSDVVRSGRIVIVYPEGTRSRDGGLGRFRSGAARLAGRAGVPLVPVAIVGTRDLLPVHGRLRRTAVRVRFGAPTHEIAAARIQIQVMLGLSHSSSPSGRYFRRAEIGQS